MPLLLPWVMAVACAGTLKSPYHRTPVVVLPQQHCPPAAAHGACWNGESDSSSPSFNSVSEKSVSSSSAVTLPVTLPAGVAGHACNLHTKTRQCIYVGRNPNLKRKPCIMYKPNTKVGLCRTETRQRPSAGARLTKSAVQRTASCAGGR